MARPLLPPTALRSARGVHPVDPFAGRLLRAIDVVPGEHVLDLGCGSGYFGLGLAGRGAGRVVLTDVDPSAVRCARANARRLGVDATVRRGDLFAPVAGERFDRIVANLPQTPSRRPLAVARWGGRDGLAALRRFARAAPAHLRPGGHVHVLVTGWHAAADVRALFAPRFHVRTLVALRREVVPADYDDLAPGLWDELVARRPRAVVRAGRRRLLAVRFLSARLRSPRGAAFRRSDRSKGWMAPSPARGLSREGPCPDRHLPRCAASRSASASPVSASRATSAPPPPSATRASRRSSSRCSAPRPRSSTSRRTPAAAAAAGARAPA
ncbi:MAG: methyltransferase [Planctomycetota bacterium]